MTDFARLETHHGLQVLSRVEAITTDDDRYGPAVITRCDPSVSIEIKQGPFADTDDGWTEAEALMAELDLALFASGAIQMAGRFATSDGDEAEEGAA
jgi:hypothetical protein